MTTVPDNTGASRRIGWVTLGAAVLFWLIFTWPLPRYALRGIPHTLYRGGDRVDRYMPAGDHLQLLYRFALVEDMVRGGTPWFSNVYEFNRGDDDARYSPGPFYAPFSLAFTLLARFGSWAFAWNALGFLSLWLTLLFSCKLALRFVPGRWPALAAALLAIAHPYRIENLMGGAPAGFAMLWVSMLFWGVDTAVRDGRKAGGIAVGAALWGAAWSDTQTFFFMILAAPAWGLWRLVGSASPGEGVRGVLARALRGAWPAVPFAAPAVLGLFSLSRRVAGSAHMAGGRSLREVLAYSPSPRLFFSLSPDLPVQIYLGYAWIALLAAGGVAVLLRARREPAAARRDLWTWGILGLGLAGLLLLTLGLRGPAGGAALRAARQWLPPYRMIRQPAKIFCLMPAVMSAAAALALGALARSAPRRAGALALGWLVLMGAEYRMRLRPGISLLAGDQAAYAAVSADTPSGVSARAVAVPLWPGDSHWTSICTYHALRHRVRLLNGYSPVVDAAYYTEVFLALRGINAGWLQDEDCDALLAKGIRHILLHEDAFPERVSPYPVARTLSRLLAHPRLEPIAQDREVWAFRILDGPSDRPAAPLPAWALGTGFPSRRFHAGQLRSPDPRHVSDPGATRGIFAVLEAGGPPLGLPRFSTLDEPGQQLWVRARGAGRLNVRAAAENDSDWHWEAGADVASEDWVWTTVPLRAPERYDSLRVHLEAGEGRIDVDALLLVAGSWNAPPPGGEILLPAPAFFRAGYTDTDAGDVVLVPGRVAEDRIFYGPRLPLEPGVYEAELVFSADASPGTELGRWRCDHAGVSDEARRGRPVVQGAAALLRVAIPDNRAVEFGFVFGGSAEMRLQGVRIRRLPEERPAEAGPPTMAH